MDVGANIKKLRRLRKMTQQELADKVGCTDAAIRNYETGSRTVKGEVLEKMAQALDVSPMVLKPCEVSSAGDLLYFVLQLEDELGLIPIEGSDGKMSIGFNPSAAKSPKVQMALKNWQRQQEALEAGKITSDDYELWKANLEA